jgi:hypothetical protein
MKHRVRQNWIPLSLSTAVHLLLLGLAVGVSRRAPEAQARAREVSDPSRHVEMIYVPPAEPVRPLAPAKPAALPPIHQRKEPEPEPNAPPEAVRTTGAESDEPSPASGEQAGGSPSPPSEAPRQEATSALESEARRIFGRPRLQTPAGAGPQAIRPMESYVRDDTEHCTPHPSAASDSAGLPQLGVVAGRIFRQDNGRPLAGAHLQMLGAPYVAFTDGNGEYRFRFDLALVDNCRTQYVRVSAIGYETRLLVLMVGPNARSEDVSLRRR